MTITDNPADEFVNIGTEPLLKTPTEPTAIPATKVRITLTRIRQLNAAADSLDKAERRFNTYANQLIQGRHEESSRLVGDINGAFALIAQGNTLAARDIINALTAEFNDYHA
jgi:hypothetical protein